MTWQHVLKVSIHVNFPRSRGLKDSAEEKMAQCFNQKDFTPGRNVTSATITSSKCFP